MFLYTVSICLALLLFWTTGAALHIGVFKSYRENQSWGKCTMFGILSYGFSAVFWFFCYSHKYLGW